MESSATREPEPEIPPPQRRWFQFSLRTLLLLFVVLGSSLAVFGAWGIAVFALTLGLAIYVHQFEPFPPRMELVLVLVFLLLLGLVFPIVQVVRKSSRGTQCKSNLRQIAFALQCYHTEYNGQFPPAYSVDKNGKPLLSWRVLILTLLYDESEVRLDKIFFSYNKSERWDGPTNKSLSAAPFADFSCPGDRDSDQPDSAQTNYLAVVGPGAAWGGDKPRSDADFHGDAATTIMLVEVANSGINWAEPRDLSVDALGAADGKSPALVPSSKHGQYENSFFFDAEESPCVNVAMADGSVHSLWFNGLSRDELRKVLQIGGCGPDVIHTLSHPPSPRRPNWPHIAALAVWLISVGTLLTLAVRSRKTLSSPPTPVAR